MKDLSSKGRKTAKARAGSSDDRGAANTGTRKASNARAAMRQTRRSEANKANDRKQNEGE
jgi:hypothetical protein